MAGSNFSPLTSQLPAPLQIGGDTDFTPDAWARAMLYLINRIAAIESFEPSYEAAINNLNQYGLERLNEVLLPLYAQVVNIGSLGAIFTAELTSENDVLMGSQEFIIGDIGQRSKFAYSQWMSIASADGKQAMAGFVTQYDRTNGIVYINVQETYGSGSNNAWIISASCPPILGAPVVDGGDIDSDPEYQTIPYALGLLGNGAGGASEALVTSALGLSAQAGVSLVVTSLAQLKIALGTNNLAAVDNYVEQNYNQYDPPAIAWRIGTAVQQGGLVWSLLETSLSYTDQQMLTLFNSASSVAL